MTRYLITSALPYINGIKHLGNLAGSLLPADVHARFRRQTGADTLFICATDEHGTPAELAAAAGRVDVAAYCARQHEVQADIYQRFNLSFDHFGRSSSPRNHALTQHFLARLEANGFIEERTLNQIFSVADRRFLPDRYVVGTCPHCGFDRARGDQCEDCTHAASRSSGPDLATIGDLGRNEPGAPADAPSVPAAVGARRRAARLAVVALRLAAARHLDRAQMA
jgi:methionyl-tRNA synthetase